MFEITIIDAVGIAMAGIAMILGTAAMVKATIAYQLASRSLDNTRQTQQKNPIISTGPTQSAGPTKNSYISAEETPQLPPQAIAKNLKRPPKPAGGFGSRKQSGGEKEDNQASEEKDNY